MILHKRLLCFILCTSMILSLAGCSHPAEQAIAETETRAPGDIQDTSAQDFPGETAYDTEETEPVALDQITALETSFLTFADSPQIGHVKIHSVSAQERNGVVRYTVGYSAPAGMAIQLQQGKLNHVFDMETTSQQETIVFDIPSAEVHSLNGSFDMKFAFTDEDYFLIKIITTWPEEDGSTSPDALPQDFEPFYWCDRNSSDIIKSITIHDALDDWQFSIAHTVPGTPDTIVSLCSGSSTEFLPEQAESLSGQENVFSFQIPKETVSGLDSIFIEIGSPETGKRSIRLEPPFRVRKTPGTPIEEPVQTGYAVENKMTSGNYEIHDITAQRLDNGYVRFNFDLTLSDNIHAYIQANTDIHDTNASYPLSVFYSTGERQLVSVDIPEKQLKEINYLFLYLAANNNDRNSALIWVPHSSISAAADTASQSQEIPLNCYLSQTVDEAQYQLHGCTARILANGNVRYMLRCTLPGGVLCRFFDSMTDGSKVTAWYASGARSGEHTIVVDVEQSVAMVENEFIIFADPFAAQTGAIFVIDNTLVLDSPEESQDIHVQLIR